MSRMNSHMYTTMSFKDVRLHGLLGAPNITGVNVILSPRQKEWKPVIEEIWRALLPYSLPVDRISISHDAALDMEEVLLGFSMESNSQQPGWLERVSRWQPFGKKQISSVEDRLRKDITDALQGFLGESHSAYVAGVVIWLGAEYDSLHEVAARSVILTLKKGVHYVRTIHDAQGSGVWLKEENRLELTVVRIWLAGQQAIFPKAAPVDISDTVRLWKKLWLSDVLEADLPRWDAMRALVRFDPSPDAYILKPLDQRDRILWLDPATARRIPVVSLHYRPDGWFAGESVLLQPHDKGALHWSLESDDRSITIDFRLTIQAKDGANINTATLPCFVVNPDFNHVGRHSIAAQAINTTDEAL